MQINNFNLVYTETGAGRPLLLIHGFPLSRKMWDPQLALANAARVIAPDLRGHGESEAVPGPYAMDQLAADGAALLDRLHVTQPVAVCGLSMGGYVAFAFYRQFAARTAGLIFAATKAGADSAEGKAGREKNAALAQEKGAAAIAEAMLPKMFAPQTYAAQPAVVAQVKAMMESTSVAGVAGALLGMRDRSDSTPTLAQIRVPTLVLHGVDDQLIPAKEGEAIAAGIAGAQLKLIPNAGHLLNLEQPAAFNAAVSDFLKEL
jgi:pimeloyl-ACP methyl ester carboxylesterase